MPEVTFPCPSCHKSIQCDDSYCGENIQCPMCHAQLRVPSKDKIPQDNPLVPKPGSASGAAKLAAGATAVPRPSFGAAIPVRQFDKKKVQKKSPWGMVGGIVGTIVVLGAGYYFGWPAYQKWKSGDSGDAAAAEGGKQASAQPQEQAPAEPPPPPTNAPPIAPTWTMDVSKAKISESKINGQISGTNFVADAVRMDLFGTAFVLNMRQGGGLSPDRAALVYLKINPGELPTNRVYTVATNDRSANITQVTKVWKPNPRYQAQTKNFSTGYALKLEFGSQNDQGIVPGKIYLAFPDKEQSVVSGVFTVSVTPPVPGSEAVAQPAVASPQDEESKARFQKRYGVRPR